MSEKNNETKKSVSFNEALGLALVIIAEIQNAMQDNAITVGEALQITQKVIEKMNLSDKIIITL